MKAQYYELQDAFDLRLKDFDVKISNPDDVVAQTLYSAISPGTETAAYSGAPPLRPMKVYPRLVGYCNVAKVLSTGENVTRVAPGDIILTFQSHRSHFVCSESQVIVTLDPTSDLKAAACTYLYHLGYSALLAGNVQPALNIAVIGLGTLGMTTAALSHLFACNTLVYSNQPKPDALKDIRHFFPKRLNMAQVNDLTCHTGIDLVINTSNNWNDWTLSLELVRKKGTIVNLGFPGRGVAPPSFNPLDSQYLYDKEITIKYNENVPDRELSPQEARFTLKRNMQYLLNMISLGRIQPYNIISAEVSWNQLEETYKRMLTRQNTFFTAVVDWTPYV